MIAAITGARARARARIAAYFCAKHALYAEDAIEFRPLRPVAQHVFADMLARGIVRQPAAGRFYLDMGALNADDARRRRTAVFVALSVSVLIAAGVMLLYRG